MKINRSASHSRFTRRMQSATVLVGVLAVLISANSAGAQTTYDWLDTAPDGNWKQGAPGARWSGGLWDQPPFGVLRFNNDHQLSMTNNVPGTYNMHGIIFGNFNSSARTINSGTVRFFDFSGNDPYISNDSSATHVINTNLEGDGDASDPLQIRLNGSGGLTFGGTINNQGSWIDVVGSTSSAATVTLSGSISGSGGLYKANANTTALLGADNSYTGGTTIDAGKLQLGNGGATGSLTGTSGITNNGNLTINRSNTFTQATGLNSQVITGAGSFTQGGSGITILSLANSYLGATDVNVGTLLINGNQSSATGVVTVASAATLGGAGTVGGNTTINESGKHGAGTVGTVGTQTFVGDLTYSSNSIFEWDVTDTSTYDKVVGSTGKALGGSGAKFNITTATAYSDTFWNSNRNWSDVFSVFGTGLSNWAGVFSEINGGGVVWNSGTHRGEVGPEGYVTLRGSPVNWTAVPEPTSALAGLLLTAGLVRRRRTL